VSRTAARSPRRGFLWALGASLLLHALTLTLPVTLLGTADPARRAALELPPLMEVTLLPPPSAGGAPVPVQLPAPTDRAQAPRPAGTPAEPDAPASPATPAGTQSPESAPVRTAAAAPAPLPAAAPPPAAGPEAESGPEAQPEAAVPPAAGTDRPTDNVAAAGDLPAVAAPDAPGATANEAGSATAAEAAPPPGSIRFPRSGRLEYSVTIGSPPTPVGRATYAWEADEGAYRLSLTAETTGLVGLLRRVRVVQTSEGRITPDGLRPDAFSMDRGGPSARNEFARFDWAARQLTFGYPGTIQTAALGAGTQDTLSLILQFAFVPIGDGRRDVLLATGRKLHVQTYERVGEEVVETADGDWRAWHLRRVRAQAGDEGYDMWLATDRPFLPVRIRWTDRRGRVTSATLDTVRLARD